MLLEQYMHPATCVVALTYKEDPAQLQPRDLQLFLKRLRRAISPRTLRFYAVGEYGDESQRPHYHAVLFGVCISEEETITKAWGHGFVCVQEATPGTLSYVVGYVIKKLTKEEDPRLKGRHPEFARMSLNPGIGRNALPTIASKLSDRHGAKLIADARDVPSVLLLGRKKLPLGRYLKSKLKEDLGYDLAEPSKALQEKRAEMHALREASGSHALFKAMKPFVEHQKILQAETKHRIYRQRRSI